MLNVPGKEMDLLRVTVKVPGKRPPRAVPACGLPVGLNGRVKDVPGPEGVSPGLRTSDLQPHCHVVFSAVLAELLMFFFYYLISVVFSLNIFFPRDSTV